MRKRSAFSATAALLLLLCGAPSRGTGTAEAAACDQAFPRLVRAYAQALPMRAKFKHVLVALALNQTEVEEGTVTLAAGGRMRWDYTKPPGKLAVADGKESFLFLPEAKEVFVQPLRADAPLLFRLLSGAVKLEEEVRCESASVRDGRVVLTLRLLRADAEVKTVEVTTEAATGRVIEVRYGDPLGNEVSLSLSDIERPAALPDALFSFRVPEGVRVIRAE